jgi:DNA-binding Lrp family transcriptional regulator
MNIRALDSGYQLTETDLELVQELQNSPRGSWAKIARELGVSPQTARRRWDRLADAGAAWITTYPAPGSGVIAGVVDVVCRPGAADKVAAQLVDIPKVMTVSGVTGDRDLLLSILAADMAEFRSIIQGGIGSRTDVVRVKSSLSTRVFHDGSMWRPAGAVLGPRADAGEAESGLSIRSPQTQSVLALLEKDGRLPAESIAETLDVTDTHARRVVQRLIGSQNLMQRVDMSFDQDRWPHALILWMVAPSSKIDAIAQHISSLPVTRTCSAIAGGSSNLYAVVWLQSLHEAADVEAQVVSSPDVRVVDRSIVLHYYKRLGHVFDADRRRTRHVGWAV